MRIGILTGGCSAEREVSLRTGAAMHQALLARGYTAAPIDVGPDVMERIRAEGINLALIALHGRYAGDGTVQGMVEMLGIPHAGADMIAAAIVSDKVATKKILLFEGLATPAFSVVSRREADQTAKESAALLLEAMDLPLVVKPATQGSSIGITFVRWAADLAPALELAWGYDDVALVEELIAGVEVTAPILGNADAQVLPLVEIAPAGEFFDYDAKYTPGASQRFIPPRLPAGAQEAIRDMALKAYRAVGCRDLGRVDFMVDKSGQPFILEVNAVPAFAPTSLYPAAAAAAGMELPELVERLVKMALARNKQAGNR